MVTDPIADMLTRIKNGYLARHQAVEIPYAKAKEKIAKILVKENYLKNIKVSAKGSAKDRKKIICELKYEAGKPVLSEVKRISKPGRRVYIRWQKITLVLSGYGIMLISTSKGVMTGQQAKKKKLGGEVICKIW